ncbi:uncharacterized protein LOC130920718 isoform X2 [Corythoichthys intestinalis]|nr:uncharacterized protein LOC130914274 isoform X2 [Corythoichthys intestinalis]XP_057700098.1 uncharacterized protein LOC130920718 isoform X2 [Corythoichthys intestinalis]
MEDLGDFLRQRNVPEETIEALEREKIDASTIQLMADEELKTFLPSYGDRLAVLGFSRRKESGHYNTRKSKLFERLKSKLAKRNSQSYDEGSSTSQEDCTPPNLKKTAQKAMRKIELGWMHYDEQNKSFKKVRATGGGGTRKLSISKDAQKSEIMQQAVELFFPGGKNRLGPLTDFELDLKNYEEVTVDSEISVGQLYTDTKIPLLRFYLTTQRKEKENLLSELRSSASTFERQQMSQNHSSTSFLTSASVAADLSPASFEMVHSDVIYLESTENNSVSLLSMQDGIENSFETSNIVFMGEVSENEPVNLDDTLPVSPTASTTPYSESVKKILVVHRGQVLQELIAQFSDAGLQEADVKIQLVLPDGTPEMGYDEGGVVRDCLSEFWSDFYNQCTTGTSFKVPFLRHDFGEMQWESVGRIISFGWAREKYLPIKIAPVILEQAALGYVKSDIVENFLNYMPEHERVVFETWRSDFKSVDQEDLMEILDNHSCRRLPTEINANDIIHELAHKTLVQEPAYVIEQWTKSLCTSGCNFHDLTTMYEALTPTVRKIVKSLAFPDVLNIQEKAVQKFLTSYLRNADTQHLCWFLRFCTGSDLFLEKNIIISFSKVEGFQRRPVAHTCGCVLELSIHYDSLPDFSAEMNRVLESNVWVMDIV